MSAREHERAAARNAHLASQEQERDEEQNQQQNGEEEQKEEEEKGQQQQQPVPKFSRYRSLRGRSAPLAPKTVQPSLPINGSHHSPEGTGAQQNQNHVEATTENSIARSMSRYRRRRNSVTTGNDVTPKITKVAEPPHIGPAVPQLPSTLKSSGQHHANFAHKEKDEPPAASRGSSSSSKRHHPPGPVGASNNLENQRMADYQTRPATANDPAQPRTMAERSDRDRHFWEQQDAVKHIREAARQEAETDRILAEQKMRDLERLQLQLASGHQPAARAKPRSPVIEKFVMLTRGRKSKDGLSPGRSPTSSSAGSVDYIHSTMDLPEVPKIPTGIEVGGKGIVPQTDAPISAVNAGDRVVTVRCKQHTFALPVTPETTPEDIIDSTIKQMTLHTELSARSCVVLESYGSLGIERRIRRYEKIRETMNSWDRDSHNHLIVAMSDTPGGDRDLELSAVPDTEEPPRGDRFYMYHSNRPAKWNKRWITLMDNGQMMSSKRPETSGVDKDTFRLCHLSDYDIYRPTESQMRRHIKPPKKHCFVIKSQHKASMFMNAENYVQYFCTEDPKLAAYFFEMIFSWRSWYLVDRRPEPPPRISIPKIDDKPPQLTAPAVTPATGKTSKHGPKKSINIASANGVSLRVSIDEEPYKLGEFQPLLDMKRFDKRLSHFGQDFIPVAPDVSTMPKIPTHLNKGPKEGPSEALLGDIKSASDAAFTGNGLLAGDYVERKAAQAAAGKDAKHNPFALDTSGPFTTGPSLLNQHSETRNGQPESPSWFPSALAHSAKTRDVTERARPSTSGAPVRRDSFSRAGPASQSRPPLPPFLSQAQPRSRPGEPPHMPFQHLDDNPRFPHQRPGDKSYPPRPRPEDAPPPPRGRPDDMPRPPRQYHDDVAPPSRGRPDDVSRPPRPYHDDVPPPSRGRPDDMPRPPRQYHDDVPPPSRGRPDDMPRPPRQYHDDVPPPSRGRPDDMARPPRQGPEDLPRPSRQRPDDLPSHPRARAEEHPHPLGAHHPSSPTGSPSTAPPNRRQPPAPLINIEPAFVEPPQWVKKGRGVHAPEGMNHLVDLINVGPPKGPISSLEVPPRSLLRRNPDGAAPVRGGGMSAPNRGRGGLTRTRSKSSAAPAPRATGDVPPLPPLPGWGEVGRGDMRGDRGRDGFRTSPPRGRGQPPFRGQPQFRGPRDGPSRDRELPALPAGQFP